MIFTSSSGSNTGGYVSLIGNIIKSGVGGGVSISSDINSFIASG